MSVSSTRRVPSPVIAVCVLLLLPLSAVLAVPGDPGTGDEADVERRIVVFTDAVGAADVDDAARQVVSSARPSAPSLGLRVRPARDGSGRPAEIVSFRSVLRGFAIEVHPDDLDGLAVIEAMPDVAFVAEDLPAELHAVQDQPGMERIRVFSNALVAANGLDTGGIDADIAILDTGIDSAHPDLDVHRAVSFVAAEPSTGDGHGHGTHVAGVAAARDDGDGVYGVAPGARLWSVKVVDQFGNGLLSDVLSALDYVVENAAEIDVVNMSFGFGALGDDGDCGRTTGDALHQAVCSVVDAGIVVVASAGNAAPYGQDASLVSPASFDEVVTVSAVVETDGLGPGSGQGLPSMYGSDNSFAATFSNYGWDVDIAAPGAEIVSTAPGGGYATRTGTSAAAPHVAGAAALWIARHGKPADRDGVLHVRAELVRLAFPQAGPDEGFTGDKETFAEPLLNVAALDPAAYDAVEPRLATDRAAYAYGTDSTAAVTVHVMDGAGLPMTGLPSNGFLSWLGRRQVDAPFAETGGGDYTLTVDISGLLPGDHAFTVLVTSLEGASRSAGCRIVVRDTQPRLLMRDLAFAWPVVDPAWLLAQNPLTVSLRDENGAPVDVPSSAFQTAFSGGGPDLVWTKPPADFITGLSPGITYGTYQTAVTNVSSLPLGTHVADVTVASDGLSDSGSAAFEIANRAPALDALLERNLARFDHTQPLPPPDLDLRLQVTNEWETGVSGLPFVVSEPFETLVDGQPLAGVSWTEDAVQSGIYVARDVPVGQLGHGLHDVVVRVTDSRGLVTDSNAVTIDIVRGTGPCADPSASDGDPDADADGVRDACDNCPQAANPSQRNSGAGSGPERKRGDACKDHARIWVSSDPDDAADYGTIQDAIDRASPGTNGTQIVVLPGAGPYVESVVVDRGFSLEITGRAGAAGRPVIEATPSSVAALETRSTGTRPILVRGLVVRGAPGTAGQSGIEAQPGVAMLLLDLRLERLDRGLLLRSGSHTASGIEADGSVGTAIVLEDGSLSLARTELRGTPRALHLSGGSATASVATLLHSGDGTSVGIVNESTLAGALAVSHSTLVNGGTAISGSGSNTTVSHSILWSNQVGLAGVSCLDVSWSNVQDLDCGGSNLSVDPLFVDAAAGDLRLQDASPLADHGPDPSAWSGAPCLDLDGAPRLRDHDGDGLSRVDPGAYERAAPTPAPPEILGVRWSGDATLTWTPEPAAVRYHVYRSTVSSLGYFDYGTCSDAADPVTTDTVFVDDAVPPPGEAFYYEITAESAPGDESTLGLGSCAERSNFTPCP